MVRDDNVCGMAGKGVKNHVNSIHEFLIQIAEPILAIKKGNSIKSDEGSNFVDILAGVYQSQVHSVEHECFERRGIYEREHTEHSRVLGDSEGFEAGHFNTKGVVCPVTVETPPGLNGEICQGRNRQDRAKSVEFKTEIAAFSALNCQSRDIGNRWQRVERSCCVDPNSTQSRCTSGKD